MDSERPVERRTPVAYRERHGPGWRSAQPEPCVAVRLCGDLAAEPFAAPMAYAHLPDDPGVPGTDLPDFLQPLRSDGPHDSRPADRLERHRRCVRRGELQRRAPDLIGPLNGPRTDVARGERRTQR